MTPDATRALAAAMHDSYLRDPGVTRIEWRHLSTPEQAMWNRHAAAISAALAAAGYRITNEPPLTPESLAAARMSDEMEEWGYPIDAMEYATAILAALTSEELT